MGNVHLTPATMTRLLEYMKANPVLTSRGYAVEDLLTKAKELEALQETVGLMRQLINELERGKS